MSLDVLSRDIFSQAEEEIKQLEQETQEEISQIKEEAYSRVEEYKKELYSRYSQESISLKESILGAYKREAKKILLESQRQLLEEIKQEILKELESDAKLRETIFKSLFSKAKKEITVHSLTCSSSDKKLFEKIVPKSVSIQTAKNFDGVEFESKDKKHLVSITIEDLLESIIEERGEEIYNELFSK